MKFIVLICMMISGNLLAVSPDSAEDLFIVLSKIKSIKRGPAPGGVKIDQELRRLYKYALVEVNRKMLEKAPPSKIPNIEELQSVAQSQKAQIYDEDVSFIKSLESLGFLNGAQIKDLSETHTRDFTEKFAEINDEIASNIIFWERDLKSKIRRTNRCSLKYACGKVLNTVSTLYNWSLCKIVGELTAKHGTQLVEKYSPSLSRNIPLNPLLKALGGGLGFYLFYLKTPLYLAKFAAFSLGSKFLQDKINGPTFDDSRALVEYLPQRKLMSSAVSRLSFIGLAIAGSLKAKNWEYGVVAASSLSGSFIAEKIAKNIYPDETLENHLIRHALMNMGMQLGQYASAYGLYFMGPSGLPSKVQFVQDKLLSEIHRESGISGAKQLQVSNPKSLSYLYYHFFKETLPPFQVSWLDGNRVISIECMIQGQNVTCDSHISNPTIGEI